ncbi:MAG TPA: serine/threonine-protein kinase [Vicinamibacterales bacterium]|nr:serine/threonine-protein kinase [Vicinamibacterales bacterium]
MIGTTVGKYRIIDKLGRGGMGTVYKAVDETLDREVAIKVLNHDLTDADVLKRFRAEAVTLARLNHPGIATIFELHQQQDDLLMVMEFVRGETFHDLSNRMGAIAPPQAAHLCMQVLEALGHAHRAGVVHRDLKPANLMIAENGAVKIMDFGIARVLGTEHFTHGGYMMGTPAYMAPEQVLGREIDGRADLYSVGVVLYRLLSGRLPFNADTAISMVQMQISEAPTPILSFKPDLPAWCAAIVERALAKSPSDRFQSAEEFRAALLAAVTPQALGEMPTLATPTTGLALDPDATLPHRTPAATRAMAAPSSSGAYSVQGVRAALQAPTPTPTSIPPAERTGTTVVLGRTHLAAMGIGLVILAVGIAVLAVAALRGGRPSTESPVPGQTPQQLATQGTSVPPPTSTIAASDGSVPPPAAPAPPPVPPAPKPSATSPVTATPATPAPGTVATAGASPAGAKLTGRGTTPGVTPTDAGGRGATSAKETVSVPPASPSAAAPGAALPMATFNQVRVLVNEGDKAREREGILQIGEGRVAIVGAGGGTAIMSLPTSALTGVYYARSKQPKWQDASGKEVESRIDLGRMGFLRGDRNWVILMTHGEPVILRIEDSALRTVLPAIEERTGHKIQRVRQ